ncbi:MAG: cell division ATP-binding protein FtsE [Cyanobacteria bacterium J06627_28]
MISLLTRKAKAASAASPQAPERPAAQPNVHFTAEPLIYPDAAHPGNVPSPPHPQAPVSPQSTDEAPTASPEAATSSIISLNHISKTYPNGTPALVDVNLALNKGDFLFITGPSGAGKSTLLKMLYGQERPTEGQVHINGQDISQLRGNRLAMLRRRIGIIFQDYKLIPRRTVAENVAFVLHAQGYSRKEINRRLPVTLKMVGLQNKADRFPSQLSGGEQQRASIARAVVGTPPILLADEPTGNLDSDNARQVFNILRKLNGIGITVVVTTHDEMMVRSLNYPVVQIRDSRLYNIR